MASSANQEDAKEEHVPDWLLAKQGIRMLINNDAKEAQELFSTHQDSLVMFAGYSFATFMDALMTFEEDKLQLATSVLKEVERKCTSETGWFKSMKKVFGGTDNQQSLAESLETQIILADSQVCLAILTFLQQDISGYFKGGWVLRKAWKVYQSAYHDVLQLYKEVVGEAQLPGSAVTDEPDDTWNGAVAEVEPPLSSPESSSSPPVITNGCRAQQIDKATIQRLMGAVSFGYGLFQLGISLLPPSLLKLTNFLGFGGNRQNGIACLMYARQGVDMRAPLATLSLLWYHTIVRPFYALDGSNVQAGVKAAMQLLEESELEYGQSSLFLFFKGRCYRLNSDIPTALKSFQMAVDNAAQREIRILAMHEVGWCHLIQLDYCVAESTFAYLKTWSRWSRAFYNYLTGICCGACGSGNYVHIKEIKINTGTRGNQLEEFLGRRANCCPGEEEVLARLPTVFWKLLVYEMLYLWNALPSCSSENIEVIKRDCQSVEGGADEPMLGLSHLILGACYCIQKNYEEGIDRFRTCLELRKNLPHNGMDAHVSAFSQYELGSLLIKSNETKLEGKTLLQTINQYKEYDFEQRLNYPLVKAFLAGSFSGTFSTILFQPLDLVKTRLQNPTALLQGHNGGPRMVTIFANILQQEHLRGLWRGMTPSITRCVPGVGLYFCFLDYLKTQFFADRTPAPLESVALGMVARCMSGVALIPITVVKTRFESGVYGYNGVLSALREIYRTEGLRGMTCGLIPTLFRDAPFSGLYLMFYTQTKLLVPPKIFDSSMASPAHFTCGVTAGILASVVTQPADVLKTKMQLYPNKFKGLWSVVVYVHGKYGVRGYFKGMVPRMLRRTLMAAMAWTVYERISKSIGLK